MIQLKTSNQTIISEQREYIFTNLDVHSWVYVPGYVWVAGSMVGLHNTLNTLGWMIVDWNGTLLSTWHNGLPVSLGWSGTLPNATELLKTVGMSFVDYDC